MLMMCFFYCIPLAHGIFLVSGPLLILASMFVLKRGIRQSRAGLRQLAFLFLLIASIKILTVDVYLARSYLLCKILPSLHVCSEQGAKMLQGGALLLLVLVGFFLFNLYRSFAQDKPQRHITPDEAHLAFWGNLSIILVVGLILWIAAPWVGYLTVGHVPSFFAEVPWQNLALINVAVLLRGFWNLEDCSWTYDPALKERKKYQANVWTAKDTLWVSVILFVIALAFSYASSDVLSTATPARGGHLNIFDLVDIHLDAPDLAQRPDLEPQKQR